MTYRTLVSILIWTGACIAATETLQAQQTTVTCSSINGQRQECPADTSGGVAVQRVLNDSVCLLGRSWGYDDKGIRVTSGCSAEFVLGNVAPGPATTPPPEAPSIPTWGAVEPGKGFLVGKTEIGELYISSYALFRYLNQLPPGQTFTDQLGVTHNVDPRNDFFSHRVMVFLKGWIGLPRLIYVVTLWTVNTTDQKARFCSARIPVQQEV